MPALRLPSLSQARRPPAPILLLPILLALVGCGGGTEDAFAPACPGAAIVRDAADLSRYRGAGRDLTDSVVEDASPASTEAASETGRTQWSRPSRSA